MIILSGGIINLGGAFMYGQPHVSISDPKSVFSCTWSQVPATKPTCVGNSFFQIRQRALPAGVVLAISLCKTSYADPTPGREDAGIFQGWKQW